MSTLTAKFRFSREGFRLTVDLELPEGVTGILGPSGSGKTTLLRLIAGLERSDDADVRLGDRTWECRNPSTFVPTHQRGIGFVFQEPSLFSHLDVKRNLEYGYRRTPVSARTLAFDDAVGLLGLGPLLSRTTRALSGGERQRVAIARALLAGPQLLCLDEPLANVDPDQRHEVLTYLERVPLEVQTPVIYVSHQREEVARLADYLVVLKNGSVETAGPLDDVLTDLDFSLAHARDAGVVITGTVVARDERYVLTTLNIGDAELVVAGVDRPMGSEVRVRIAARDVSITLEKAEATSILNVLPAVVVDLAKASSGQSTVRLQMGRHLILAKITQKSVDRLALQPGTKVFAQIKGVAVAG